MQPLLPHSQARVRLQDASPNKLRLLANYPMTYDYDLIRCRLYPDLVSFAMLWPILDAFHGILFLNKINHVLRDFVL